MAYLCAELEYEASQGSGSDLDSSTDLELD